MKVSLGIWLCQLYARIGEHEGVDEKAIRRAAGDGSRTFPKNKNYFSALNLFPRPLGRSETRKPATRPDLAK
jgi:hypothetical protein